MGRVSAQDWARAALDALAEDGFAAVAVEPVAARLGVTKGSFYWHFANRQKLIEAALALWEADSEQIIANLWEITDPARRMRTLLGAAFGDPRDAAIAFRLIGAADDPAVAEVARRVTARRLDVMRQTLEELGQPPDLARRRVLAGYGVYVGVAALRRIGMLDDSAEFVETAVAEMGLDLPR